MSMEAEREALRVRQGGGARYDARSAPHDALAEARLAAAYFARGLGNLSDADLEDASRRGAARRGTVAFVGYEARRLAEIVAFARGGFRGEAPAGPVPSFDEMRDGATLPPQALRHLAKHAAAHLDVEWRDAKDVDWEASVTDVSGLDVGLRETPLQRALSLWRASLDLDAGGRLSDVPPGLRARVAEASPLVQRALAFHSRRLE